MADSPCFWWDDEKDGAHEALSAYVQTLDQDQAQIALLAQTNASLYANRDMTSGRTSGVPRTFAVTENISASCVDTATALIARNRSRPTFQTDGADWSTKMRAQGLERFVEALYDELRVYELAQAAFRDAAIYGTGGLKVCVDEGEIVVERVVMGPRPEIIVDEQTCQNCDPREMYQRKWVDRAVLTAMYPDFAEDIKNAASSSDPSRFTGRREKNQVCVLMAWHLPSSEKAGDGRYVECLDNVTLKDTKWTKPRFPFVFFRWSEPLTGFYGQGLVEQLTGIQLRLNKLNKFIARCQDLISVPHVYGNFGLKGPSRIDNEIGTYVNTRDGKPPTFYTPPAVANEIYAEREYLNRRAYELTGISMLSATSRKPGGLESGEALNAYSDIESQRFACQAQRYEGMQVDLAALVVLMAKDAYGKKGKKVRFKARRFVETIDWAAVDPKEDIYRIDIEAASILSRTPAGRLSSVENLFNKGLIDRDEGRELLGHPDLKRSDDINTASFNDIEAVIEKLLNGEWEAPEPFQDLVKGPKRVQFAYLEARRDGAPEQILELMRRWVDTALTLAQPPAPPPGAMAPPGAEGPQGPPPGMPMPMAA